MLVKISYSKNNIIIIYFAQDKVFPDLFIYLWCCMCILNAYISIYKYIYK